MEWAEREQALNLRANAAANDELLVSALWSMSAHTTGNGFFLPVRFWLLGSSHFVVAYSSHSCRFSFSLCRVPTALNPTLR